ncbi:MAG: hypothetical protein GY868_01380, partial [Deltaproteobacteria bacterium]|nr:hypothetical protein [Deltaproteobacteria bacterium]
MKRCIGMALFFVLVVCVSAVSAQDYASRDEMLQMKKEMAELKALVGEMKGIIKQQNVTIHSLKQYSDEDDHGEEVVASKVVRDDHDEAEAHDDGLEEILESIKPQIAVIGDFVANVADDSHMRTEDDRFDLRAVDLFMSGEVDGMGKAFFNFSYHDDDVNLEEGYMDAYDILWGIDLRFGRFRTLYGLLNTVHQHDLPQADYPAVYLEYLGHEGYIDEGIGISGDIKMPWEKPLFYSLQVLNGNRHEHDEEEEGDAHDHGDGQLYDRMKDYNDLVWIARLQQEVHLSDALDLNIGVSQLSGKFDADDSAPRYWLTGADLTVIWRPFEEKYRRIRLQGEFMSSHIDDVGRIRERSYDTYSIEQYDESWERSYGLYTFVDYAFKPDWL